MSFAGVRGSGIAVQELYWDFAAGDSATVAAHELTALRGLDDLPVGSIVKAVTAFVEDAVTSAGSLTAEWGDGDDPDGYSGTAIAKASLTAGAIFNGWDNGAALIWDDTNDHMTYKYVADANDGKFDLTFNVAAATAGKMVFMREYLYPSAPGLS